LLINLPSTPGLKRYLPEEGAGTRDLIQNAGKESPNWPKYGADSNVEQVPDYLEELKGATFFEIVSYPQEFQRTRKAATCTELHDLDIRSAAVCADGDKCNGFVLADYRLIIKIKPDLGPSGKRFTIVKPSECKVTQTLVHDIKNCEVDGELQNHIITKVADLSPPPPLPAYLMCPR